MYLYTAKQETSMSVKYWELLILVDNLVDVNAFHDVQVH